MNWSYKKSRRFFPDVTPQTWKLQNCQTRNVSSYLISRLSTLENSFGDWRGGEQERHFTTRHLPRPLTPAAPGRKPLPLRSHMDESQKPACAMQGCTGCFLTNTRESTHLIVDFLIRQKKSEKNPRKYYCSFGSQQQNSKTRNTVQNHIPNGDRTKVKQFLIQDGFQIQGYKK